jgi:hypothetical protein
MPVNRARVTDEEYVNLRKKKHLRKRKISPGANCELSWEQLRDNVYLDSPRPAIWVSRLAAVKTWRGETGRPADSKASATQVLQVLSTLNLWVDG